MTKSHVGMGFSLCPICYCKHNEVVLLDRRLKDSLEPESFTGFELCPEHEAMKVEYIALVEVENMPPSGRLKPQDAVPTGNVAHLKRAVAAQVFNIPLPDDLAFVYVQPDVIKQLQGMQAPE